MAKKHNLKEAVKKQERNSKAKTASPQQIIISEREATIFGFRNRAANANNRERPYISLRYFDGSYECFSKWTKEELAAFTDLLRRISQMTWTQIMATGGKGGNKTGLGCTKLEARILPSSATNGLSEDLPFMELRVTQKARIHGFRMNEAFFLLCLDREHKVCPS